MGLTLVWTLLLDLSGLGGPTRGVNTPAGIALGVIGTHKPLSHVKATVSVSGNVRRFEGYLQKNFNFFHQASVFGKIIYIQILVEIIVIFLLRCLKPLLPKCQRFPRRLSVVCFGHRQ